MFGYLGMNNDSVWPKPFWGSQTWIEPKETNPSIHLGKNVVEVWRNPKITTATSSYSSSPLHNSPHLHDSLSIDYYDWSVDIHESPASHHTN